MPVALKHVPVLPRETLEAFAPLAHAAGTVLDGTLGGGGHTEALLEAYPLARVLACDLDARAIEREGKRLEKHVAAGRLALHHGNFAHVVDKDLDIAKGFEPPWAGALLDLGYSSIQLEDPTYGLSFSAEGPLDMRLGPTAMTAWDLIRESTDVELGEILAAYGEITGSMRLARKIRQAVLSGEIPNSTRRLAELIESVMGTARGGRGRRGGGKRRDQGIHPATLVFQALRIAVNDELRNLDHFLQGVILNLKTGGRVAVISFHSLEDRLVKHWGNRCAGVMRAVTRKPIMAGEAETAANPRARSAKLRVYEKI